MFDNRADEISRPATRHALSKWSLFQTLLILKTLLAAIALASFAVASDGPQISDPEKVDDDYKFQGEYVGELKGGDGSERFGVQIIALGDGKFQAVAYPGGLPGEGWNGEEPRPSTDEGVRDDEQVVFKSDLSEAVIRDGNIQVTSTNGEPLGTLAKVSRRSHTMGAKPPEGAVVLFDGKSVDKWENGNMTDDGLLKEGTQSKDTFKSHKLHIEFRLPYQPKDRGQARGNSGIYLQGKYEVQMLDSFGLKGEQNECGGIYSVKAPDVNMCLPPLVWQTYDITYTAAKYDDEGTLVSSPHVTVVHNGVKIHDNVELPADRSTTAAPVKPGPEAGPIYLQNHGNPVRYRNIWVESIDE